MKLKFHSHLRHPLQSGRCRSGVQFRKEIAASALDWAEWIHRVDLTVAFILNALAVRWGSLLFQGTCS